MPVAPRDEEDDGSAATLRILDDEGRAESGYDDVLVVGGAGGSDCGSSARRRCDENPDVLPSYVADGVVVAENEVGREAAGRDDMGRTGGGGREECVDAIRLFIVLFFLSCKWAIGEGRGREEELIVQHASGYRPFAVQVLFVAITK